MLDGDKQVLIMPEAVFEPFVTDQLDRFGVNAAPGPDPVFDNLGRKKIDGLDRESGGLGWRVFVR
jgi:hypothetical protein